jgi:Fe-S cluster assembly protein SufD
MTKGAEQFQEAVASYFEKTIKGRRDTEWRTKFWDRFSELGLPIYRYGRFQDLYADLREIADGGWEIQGPTQDLEILSLQQADRTYGNYLQSRWAQNLKLETDGFILLNGALHNGGLFLYVPPGVEVVEPIELRPVIETQERACFFTRLHLIVGAHARVKVIVGGDYVGPLMANQVIDAALEEGSQLELARAVTDSPSAWIFDGFRATVKRSASLKSLYLTDGGRAVSTRFHVTLLEEGAEADLSGAALLAQKAQTHTVARVEHLAPYCRSLQLFKKVLTGYSRASFAGMIDVAPEAQRTDAYQTNKNLLLSDGATANSKPELRIRADDVKASHGATVGKMDAEELFYLQSRGLTMAEARRLLVGGFVADVQGRLFGGDLQDRLQRAIHRVCET